jgi:hypothetical protein
MSENIPFGKSEKAAACDFVKAAKAVLKKENISDVRCVIRRSPDGFVLRLIGGTADERFLAEKALHKHISFRSKLPSQEE